VSETIIWADYYRDFLKPDEDPLEPVSDIYYPVFDTLESVRVNTKKNEPGK